MKERSFAFLLIFFLLAPSLGAQENEEKTISGSVSDIDWVGSTIVVRYYPTLNPNVDEISLKITNNTVMHRGPDSINLSDIELADPITVTYYDDGMSGIKVKRLTDLNLANR